jgi:hypothetical protein
MRTVLHLDLAAKILYVFPDQSHCLSVASRFLPCS